MRARDIMEKLKTEEEKEWFAEAMTAVILADKMVAKNEMRPIEDVFKYLQPTKREELTACLKKREMAADLPEAPQFENREFAFKILSYYVGVTASDGNITPVEEEILEIIQQKLGFHEKDLQGLLSEWRKLMQSKKQFEDAIHEIQKNALEKK